jgi:hypothetical protein
MVCKSQSNGKQLFDVEDHKNHEGTVKSVCKGTVSFSRDKYRVAAPPESMGISSLSTNRPYCH